MAGLVTVLSGVFAGSGGLSPDPLTEWAWRGTGVPSEQGGW